MSRTTPTQRFSWGITRDEARGLLEEAYRQVVTKRRASLVLDNATREALDKTAIWLTDRSRKPSMLFYGTCGTGKTTMIYAIAYAISTLSKEIKAQYPNPFEREQEPFASILKMPSLEFASAQGLADWAAEAKATLGRSEIDRLDAAKKSRFLAIDDLGCEPASVKNYGTEITPVTDVIYARYDAMLPTIISTNLDKKLIRGSYGDRVADRLNEQFEYIAFNNQSYRK